MSSTAHEDQYTTAPEPLHQPYDTATILRRNVANAEKEMQRQAERAESYAETLRSIASYVGAGGYNADTVDAGVFEGKIRWGIGEIMKRMEKVEAELVKLRGQKPVAWINLNKWTPSDWPRCVTPEEYEKKLELLTKLTAVYAAPVPAPAVPATYEIEDQLSLAETEMINAKAWSAGSQSRIHIGFAMTAISCARALLQSAKVTDNAAADRLLESGE